MPAKKQRPRPTGKKGFRGKRAPAKKKIGGMNQIGGLHRLLVVRSRGPKEGEGYFRYFKNAKAMQDYVNRQAKAGVEGQDYYEAGKVTNPFQFEKVGKQTLGSHLKNWAQEGLGINKMTNAEEQFVKDFVAENGRVPKWHEDPNLVDRGVKLMDKTFDAMLIAAGPGIALSAIKAGVKGTQLATAGVIKATTKKAMKKALKNAGKELTKKATIKATTGRGAKHTVKGGLKTMDASWKAEVVSEFAKMTKKGYKNISSAKK